jgi:hypothetical protein
MLVRATTKNYNLVVSELIDRLRGADRLHAGDAVRAFLAAQRSDSRYWPDDEEVRNVMPRKWATHWSRPSGPDGEAVRDRLVHTLGNLTLLNGRLNSKVSNGPWLGTDGKRAGLNAHDALFLNRLLLKQAGDTWTEQGIRTRTEELSGLVVEIWPVPPGHRSDFTQHKRQPRHKVGLDDLINAGVLEPGTSLFPRRKKHAGRVATLLADGRIDVDGTVYPQPAAAAAAINGKPTNHATGFYL